MADVTGPISTLSGAMHAVPTGQKCDSHPRRKAVARVQGETDSFGSEMHDMCEECLDRYRAWKNSPEAAEHRKGICEWCKSPAEDFEEGTCGRVYRVCGACVKRQNDELLADSDGYDDAFWDDGGDYDD